MADSILLKPGRLTEEEFEAMKGHAVMGARIMGGSRCETLGLAEDIALSHHERWDGTGYPHGLPGEAIPLARRIVAVADVFDALTHARPYKWAWAVGEAVAELDRQRGRHFEPRLVDVFEQALAEGCVPDARL